MVPATNLTYLRVSHLQTVIIDTINPSLAFATVPYTASTPCRSLATINNTLNITITANETLKAANITILGSTYVMDVSGTVANASVIVYQNSARRRGIIQHYSL